MQELLHNVKKELETIGDKGLTSSNLDTAYKLIDIYKDIKEAEYYDNCSNSSYGTVYRGGDRYNESYPISERDERYINRIKEGVHNYNEGRNRYRDGGSKERMIDGVDMAMGALVNFVEYMMDNVETAQEKEVVRKHIDKLKKL